MFIFSIFLRISTVSAQNSDNFVDETVSDQGEMGVSSDIIDSRYPIFPPDSGEKRGFLGQDHRYSVVFRGNGEAVVSARIALHNDGDEDLSRVELRVPNYPVESATAYQVIREPYCIRYLPIKDSVEACAQYQEPDYFDYYYGSSKYEEAVAKFEGDTLVVDLPSPIEPGESGAYFIYYRTPHVTDESFLGAYDYNFETLKTDDDIRNMSVGISTDSDLKLKGIESDVNYREDVATLTAPVADMAMVKDGAAFDRYYNQIGYGQINKTASNLAPYESFTVEGKYADSTLKLYGKEILVALISILIFILVVVLITKYLFKKFSGKNKGDQPKSDIDEKAKTVVISVVSSFASAIVIILFTVGIFFSGEFIENISINYRYKNPMIILLLVISIAFCSFSILTPAVLVGYKKGIVWGFLTFFFTLIWLMFIMMLFMVSFSLLFSTDRAVIDPIIY